MLLTDSGSTNTQFLMYNSQNKTPSNIKYSIFHLILYSVRKNVSHCY